MQRRSWLDRPEIRGAIRLAVAVSVANAILLTVFGSTTAAVLGSFAVVIQLYFLDFDGDRRERAVGQGAATVLGAVAVALGTLLAGPLWLAVASTFVVSAVFSLARVLRGYVARSAVGLQGAFFLPLMVPATRSELGELVAAWLIGSAVAVLSALYLLPHRRSGAVRASMSAWLAAMAAFTRALRNADAATELAQARERASQAADALLAEITGSLVRPGAVGRRERALSLMVARARWSTPVIDDVTPLPRGDDPMLVDVSATAFDQAAAVVRGQHPTAPIVDVPAVRRDDLDRLVASPPADLDGYYPVRATSIAASAQLWLAGQSNGVDIARPDVGSIGDESPIELIRTAIRWDSVWLHNALRTGLAAAACVWLVRDLGLEHGIWVVFVALTTIQGTFSGGSAMRVFVATCTGAVGGVVLAGALLAAHPPYIVFVMLLPVTAFVAKAVATTGPMWAQLAYTPFALVNVAVLSWPTAANVAAVRLEDVTLGAIVAVVVSVAVFPFGLGRVIAARQRAARTLTTAYLAAAIDAAQGGDPVDPSLRARGDVALSELRHVLDAAYMRPSAADGELEAYERANALAHDRFVGGDVCADLAHRRDADARFAPVAQAFSQWWTRYLVEV